MPMDTEETIQARRNRLSSVPRACEGCKVRKIRCDRNIPCANCQATRITCRHPNDKPRGQLQADRVASLENLTDRLERRLRSVESRLATLEHSQPTPVVRDAASLDVSSFASRPAGDGHLFEGEPSFTSQSFQASGSAQIAALSTCDNDDPDIDHLFNQLQKALDASQSLSKDNFFLRRSTSQGVSKTQHLPAALVTCILQRMRAHRPIFLSSYAISDLSLVEALCQSVYYTSESASVGEVASMHGVLFFVLKEFIAMEDLLCQKFNLATYLELCEDNFVAAMETYEILAVPSFENILALTMGMVKAQGEAKPYLYWKLVSAAVTHCQSLGYHRESTYQSVPYIKSENIRRLFWTVYTFDKNMSLVLGRVSNMQGLEIDTKYPTISTNSALRAWDESFIMGIKLAELQGRIFASLYSTATKARDLLERSHLINDLAAAMDKWYLDLQQINSEGVNNPQVFHLSRGNWDILFYSTLTLLFHASSVTGVELQINSRCLVAARSSLRSHLDLFPQYQNSQLLSDSDYLNWILLSSSFIPFIVVFLHAIAAKDTESAALLEQVMGTLEQSRNVSQSSEHFYKICASFTEVVKKLVQSQQLPIGIYNGQQNSLSFPGIPESGDMNHASPSSALGIVNNWLSEPPFPWDKFDVDFADFP